MIRRREYSTVSRAYAQALFGAGRRLGLLAALSEECQTLAKLLRSEPRLLRFLENPGVSKQSREELLAKVFAGRLSMPATRLMNLMVERERAQHLLEILDLLGELVEEAEGIRPAAVASARELPAEERERLTKVLERYAKSKLRLDFHVDPNLIGGVVFQFGDLSVDGSVRNGLEEIRRNLAQTQILNVPAS